MEGMNLSQTAQAELSDYLHAKNEALQKQQFHQHLTNRKKNSVNTGNNCFLRPAGPWNHTYTEIHDDAMMHRHPQDHRNMAMNEDDADPVYEEIERGEIHISDMSDEDGKRQSDMSRQSSRSYGDHRPLIPHSPAGDRNLHCMDGMVDLHGQHHGHYPSDIEHYRMGLGLGGLSGLGLEMARHNMYRGGGENARSLAAVLDGETVVCHLEPPEFFSHDMYNSRTVVLPPNSES